MSTAAIMISSKPTYIVGLQLAKDTREFEVLVFITIQLDRRHQVNQWLFEEGLGV